MYILWIVYITESKEGKTLIEDEEIAYRWQQYTEELYDDPDELEALERRGDYPRRTRSNNNKGRIWKSIIGNEIKKKYTE